jgi:endonuclease YncB( thermonuclease family)
MSTRVRSLLLTVFLSIVVSTLVLGGIAWYRRSTPPVTSASPTVATKRSVEAAPPPSPLLAPAQPQAASALAPVGTTIVLQPPFTIVDGLTVRSGGNTVRLAQLDGPSREAVCFDNAGGLWACGLRARVALHNLLADRPLDCRVVGQEGTTPLAHCRRDGTDLGRALVVAGWARPRLDQQADYGSEVRKAQAAGLGLWETGWRIRTRADPAPPGRSSPP